MFSLCFNRYFKSGKPDQRAVYITKNYICKFVHKYYQVTRSDLKIGFSLLSDLSLSSKFYLYLQKCYLLLNWAVQLQNTIFCQRKMRWKKMRDKIPSFIRSDETDKLLLRCALFLSGRCNRISFLRKPIKVSGIFREKL